MRYFSFNVLGWINTQATRASSYEEAERNAFSLAKGDAWGIREISEEEYHEIIDSWWG